MAVVTIAEAAVELDRSVDTIQRWVREGAPVVARGGRGRGRATTVDLDAVKRWRSVVQAPKGALVEDVGKILLDFFRRGAESPREPGHRLLGIPGDRAAAFLVFLFEYLAIRLAGERVEVPAVRLLEEIARQGLKAAPVRHSA